MKLRLLTLAATAGVASASNASASGGSLRAQDERSLQFPASIACLIGGGAVADCCGNPNPNSPNPNAAEPDAVCTLLTCVDLNDISVTNACDCTQIVSACGGVVAFDAMVPGIAGMCTKVGECCGNAATNDSFNGCMADAMTDIDVPDFAGLIPGLTMEPGPVLFDETTPATGAGADPYTGPTVPSVTIDEPIGVDVGLGPELVGPTDPAGPIEFGPGPADTGMVATTGATTAATEAAATTEATEPASGTADPDASKEQGSSDASTRAVETLVFLVGSSLAMAVV